VCNGVENPQVTKQLSVSAVTGKCVRVHVAASHKFCIHCRDIRVSEREREREREMEWN